MGYQVEIFESDEKRMLERHLAAMRPYAQAPDGKRVVVTIDPDVCHQRIVGFGGAITDAVALNYQQLNQTQRKQFLDWYFSPAGAGYTLCRIPIQGCDFGQGPFTYARRPWDRKLHHFSLAHDCAHILPVIKDALRHARGYGIDLQFMATPWSPSWYLKSNLFPRYGGRLRKRAYRRWAHTIARFVSEYAAEGVPITRVSMQNEPEAKQTWESCLMTPAEEARLALHVREQLDAAGHPDVKLLVWDHNKDRLPGRIAQTLNAPGAKDVVDGIAFHWYAGYLFENVQSTAQHWPHLELIASEATEYFCEIGNEPLEHGENYAYDIIGDLNAGAHAWIDWNMLLDEQGGPTYVRNYCAAPLRLDRRTGLLHVMRAAAYLAHFTRFIRPGAQRVGLDCAGLETDVTAVRNPEGNFGGVCMTATKNPDGSIACVILNSGDSPRDLAVQLAGCNQVLDYHAREHSIATLVFS